MSLWFYLALFEEFLHYYDTAVFLREDGSTDLTTNVEILTRLCVERGLRLDNSKQCVDDLTVYPKEVFCPVEYETGKLKKSRNTVCIHWFSASWHTQQELDQIAKEKRQKEQERRSRLRVRVGTALFGEKGYEKLKAILKK